MEKVTLHEINVLIAEAAEIGRKAYNLGRAYTNQNCPFRTGQKIKVKGECYIVTCISFDIHSNIMGKAKIAARPFTKDWKEPKKDRFGKLRAYKVLTDRNLIDDYETYLKIEE